MWLFLTVLWIGLQCVVYPDKLTFCLEKKSSVWIIVSHHSTSLVMLYGDPWDGLLCPILTPMIDSYSAGTLVMSRPKEPHVSLLNSILEFIYLMGINQVNIFI